MDFLSLKRNLKKDYSTFPGYKMAIVSNAAPQFLVQAVRGQAYNVGIDLQIFEAGIGLAHQEATHKASALYQFNPQAVFIYQAVPVLQSEFYKSNRQERESFAHHQIKHLQSLIEKLKANGIKSILSNSLPLPLDPVYGHKGLSQNSSFAFQVLTYNHLLSTLALQKNSLEIVDCQAIASFKGYHHYYDPTFYYSSQSDLSFQILPIVAYHILQKIAPDVGKVKKCIIVDLDNTLWGGVIGDDGIENIELGSLGRGKVFYDLQLWLKELKNRGIILAVASKNTETIAKEVFLKHPDVVLKLEDFALFVANWEPKKDNITFIADTLNIGIDSCVFLDDNLVERDWLRSSLPQLAIPDLPADPALWLTYLQSLALFENTVFSEEDLKRTQKYQQQAQRRQIASVFDDVAEYLKSLEMKADVKPIDSFSLPRVVQLFQRTNQFNLRTIRYTAAEIEEMLHRNALGITFRLEDKFGDEGLVSVILLKQEQDFFFIDSWVMSCRVFGRTLEHFIFNLVLQEAKKRNVNRIRAQYIPTSKNGYVKNLLPELGFQLEAEDFYSLEVTKVQAKPSYITAASSL